ncbi:hypothetical protein BD770DRAFT_413226 [Pilaira anomala]|nr:hypothetical protein BD770DRAFT_413226 [Pilaira anomala]
MIKNVHRKTKLDESYSGPLYVKSYTKNKSYIMMDGSSSEPFISRCSNASQNEVKDQHFEVQAIVAHRGVPTNYEYLVHRLGYNDPADCTWQKESDFDSKIHIELYWKRRNNNGNTKDPPLADTLNNTIPKRTNRNKHKFVILGDNRKRVIPGRMSDERKRVVVQVAKDLAVHKQTVLVNQANGARKVTKSGIQQYLARLAQLAPRTEKKERSLSSEPVQLKELELDYAEIMKDVTLEKSKGKGKEKELAADEDLTERRNRQVMQTLRALNDPLNYLPDYLKGISWEKNVIPATNKEHQAPGSSSTIPEEDRRRLDQQLVLEDIETLIQNENRTLGKIEDDILVIKGDNQNMLQELGKITHRLEQLQHRQDQMQQQFLTGLQETVNQLLLRLSSLPYPLPYPPPPPPSQ